MVEDMTAMTSAEALLRALKRQGIDYFLANAGTDFPPIIEALSRLAPDQAPQPVTVPHETAAVAMAHGYYLVSGKPLAVMVHVNVGLANAVMGVINAASDNIPLLVLSGRTPISEYGRPGSRVTPIQYGQEMYDQSSLVADVCIRSGIEQFEQARLGRRRERVGAADEDGGVGVCLQIADPALAAIAQRDFAEGLLFLADVDSCQIVGGDLAQGVDIHEQLGVTAVLAVLEEVLEFRRLVGDVIKHQIKADVVFLGDRLDIGPGAVARIDLAMRQGRETAIGIGRKGRQQMHTAKAAAEVLGQHLAQVGDAVAHPVRVGDELGLIAKHIVDYWSF